MGPEETRGSFFSERANEYSHVTSGRVVMFECTRRWLNALVVVDDDESTPSMANDGIADVPFQYAFQCPFDPHLVLSVLPSDLFDFVTKTIE